MIHPSTLAIEQIFSKFVSVYMSQDTLPIMGEVEAILRDLGHRPTTPIMAEVSIYHTV